MTRLELAEVGIRLGQRPLLDSVNLSVSSGELVALVGPNGAGKTTLLRAALGLLRPANGTVRLGGRALGELRHRERARLVAWLPQETRLGEPLSALDTVLAARFRFDETAENARGAALRALERLRAAEFAETPVTRLSGGERQRVALAALLAQESELLLLDEPASHLDPAQQAETYRLLGELARDGAGVLCVTHDVNLLTHARTPARVLGLRGGRMRFEELFSSATLPDALGELFGVPMRAVSVGGVRLIVPVLGALAAGAPATPPAS